MSAAATIEDVLSGAARWAVAEGDSGIVAQGIPDCSIDAIASDPPAGIAFMGKEWDHDRGGKEHWIEWLSGILEEAFRVLKPGGYMYLWALPRTSHWTAEAGERAGFEIVDVVQHAFGSGFPKSTNVSKAIDAAAGAERVVVGVQRLGGNAAIPTSEKGGTYAVGAGTAPAINVPITAPATPEAQRWHGWGSALKPAAEEWILFQKPLASITSDALRAATGWDHWHSMRRLDTRKQRAKAAGKYKVAIPEGGELQARTLKALHPGVASRQELRWRPARFEEAAPVDEEGEDGGERVYTEVGEWRVLWSEETPYKRWSTASIAANVLRHGTGGINVDAGRVASATPVAAHHGTVNGFSGVEGRAYNPGDAGTITQSKGRFPSNLILSHFAFEQTVCRACSLALPFIARFCPGCGSGDVEHGRDGCREVGERSVASGNAKEDRRSLDGTGATPIVPRIHNGAHYGGSDGLETVAAWECVASCNGPSGCGATARVLSGGAPPRCVCGQAMRWACPVARMDEQSGETVSGGTPPRRSGMGYMGGAEGNDSTSGVGGSEGGASRFFHCLHPPDNTEPFRYISKPSASETEAGCEALPLRSAAENVDREEGSAGTGSPRAGAGRLSGRRNHHPTKKPIALMRILCKLITPPGGIVLDLFGGSNATGCGAVLEEFRSITIELDPEHVAIARARATFWARLAGTRAASEAKPRPVRDKAPEGQGKLFA